MINRLFVIAIFLGLCNTSLSAGTGPGGGSGIKYKNGALRIVNQCDDAVSCQVGSGEPFVLEPLQAREIGFSFYGSITSQEVTVSAALVSDSSIATQSTVTVSANKTTTANISSVVSGSSVELQITVGGKGKGSSK